MYNVKIHILQYYAWYVVFLNIKFPQTLHPMGDKEHVIIKVNIYIYIMKIFMNDAQRIDAQYTCDMLWNLLIIKLQEFNLLINNLYARNLKD